MGPILPVKTINAKKLIEARKAYPYDTINIMRGEISISDSEPLCDAKTLSTLPKKDEMVFTVTIRS